MFDLQNLTKFQDLAGRKLEFQYQTSETVCLKHPDGGAIEVDRAMNRPEFVGDHQLK